MQAEAIAARVWPGREVTSSRSAAGSRTTTSRSSPAASASWSGSAARTPRCSASTGARSTRRRSSRRRRGRAGGRRVRRTAGCLVTRYVEGGRSRPRRCAGRRTCAPWRGRCGTSTTAHRPGRFDAFRVVEAYSYTAASAASGRRRATPARSSWRTRSSARAARNPAAVPQRPAERERDRRRRADPRRRLGVRRHGRRLLRPREPLRQQRARDDDGSCSRRTQASSARPTSCRCA